MQNTENPYAAPTARAVDVHSASLAKKRKLFSPQQGAIGAFFLGPITGLYIIYANFSAMDDHPRRMNTIAYGLAIVIGITLLLPFLPEKTPSIVFSLMYMLPTSFIIDKYQLKKQQILDSDQYTFQSGWMVLGIGLLCAMLFLALMIAVFFVYSALGWIEPLW